MAGSAPGMRGVGDGRERGHEELDQPRVELGAGRAAFRRRMASSVSSALRYARDVVMAEKASATAMIRAIKGMASPASPIDIAGPVPALVVVADARADQVGVGQVTHDQVAEDDVLLDDLVLVVGQGARLAQQMVRHADLADVVQQSGQPDRPDGRLVETVLLREEDRVASDVLGVPLRIAVLGVDAKTRPWRTSKVAALLSWMPLAPVTRISSPPLALAEPSVEATVARRTVSDAPSRGYVAIPALTVIGIRSAASTSRLRSTRASRDASMDGSRPARSSGGAMTRNSSGP